MKNLIFLKAAFLAAFFMSCSHSSNEAQSVQIIYDTIFKIDTFYIEPKGKLIPYCSDVIDWNSNEECYCQKKQYVMSIYDASMLCYE